MLKADTAADIPLDSEPASAGALLDDATKHKPLGMGGSKHVYSFDKVTDQHWPYIVSIGIGKMCAPLFPKLVPIALNNLDRTSALTPIETLSGMNLGQAILSVPLKGKGAAVTFHVRVPGQSLEQWCEDAVKSGSPVDTALKLMAPFERGNIGKDNPLLAIYEQVYRLRYYHGDRAFPLKMDNIMYDPSNGRINLIDLDTRPGQLSTREEALRSTRELSDFLRKGIAQKGNLQKERAQLGSDPKAALYDTAYGHFDALVRDAQRRMERRHINDAPPTLVFRKASCSAVNLESPPKALLEDLKRIQAELDIPGR